MKIAIIGSRGMHATYGGIEKVLSELCPRLVSLGHEIHVFAENSGGFPERYVNGVKIVPMPAIAGKYTESLSRTVFSLGKAILSDYARHQPRRGRPRQFQLRAAPARQADGRKHPWPRLATRQMAGAGADPLRSAERMIVRAADEVTVVSRQLESYFNKTYGRKVAYIPNGLHVRNDSPDRFLLNQVGVEPGEYILFASRLVPEKGAHELIEAFSRVNTTKKLVIAGGSRYDLNYVDSLYGMAKGDRFKFVGHVTGPLLDALFSGAYLYALPSHMEGLSLSLLEALGHGKACVVSDIPENLEVVEDCAFTFPVGDTMALSDLLQDLLDDDISVSAMSSRAGKRAKSQFAWDNLALQYSEIYERLGGGARRNVKQHSQPDEVTGPALGERTVGAD